MKSIKNNNTYTKEFNAKEVKDQVVQWIRDWFEENGKGCNAVLGVSGGKDSSIVAALCVEALGKDRVIGVTMPNGVQKDISDSMRLIITLPTKIHLVKAMVFQWSCMDVRIGP